jgi:phage gpG-like protein
MIKAYVMGHEEVIARLTRLDGELQKVIGDTTKSLALQLLRMVKEEKLSGQVLKNRTGTLRRSINLRVLESGTSTTGEVFTNLEYARINEYGGVTKPHVIRPRNGKALRFMMGGKAVFAKEVNHPGSKMPERSFLRSALSDMRPTIQRQYEEAVKKVLA